ncbi:hypothetical protein 035JT004_117 [Bacillus phage 035JT004]|nr:hypothetical protein 035JT004_117 [Bacillus phage 035JT004]
MKKWLLAPMLLLALAGCSYDNNKDKDDKWVSGRLVEVSKDYLFDRGIGTKVMQDTITGCQYILTPEDAVTPVLKEDGKPYCVKKK